LCSYRFCPNCCTCGKSQCLNGLYGQDNKCRPAAKAPVATLAKARATPAAKTATPTTAAAGSGDGKVWVNTKSKTYHREGTKFYGKTKVGEYMTEADAKAKGNHADHGNVSHILSLPSRQHPVL
jgi:hypothetical protein